MNVLVIEPGILPYEREINGLKEMQAVVGGKTKRLSSAMTKRCFQTCLSTAVWREAMAVCLARFLSVDWGRRAFVLSPQNR